MIYVVYVVLLYIAIQLTFICWGSHSYTARLLKIREDLSQTRMDYQGRLDLMALASISRDRIFSEDLLLIHAAILDLKMPFNRKASSLTHVNDSLPYLRGPKKKKKGHTGHHISDAQKKAISDAGKRRWASYSLEQRNERVAKLKGKRGRPKKAAPVEQPVKEAIAL